MAKSNAEAVGGWQKLLLLQGDRLTRSQAFVVYVYSFLAFLTLMTFGLQHALIEHDATLGYFEVASGLVMAINILVLRATHNIALARNILLMTILALLVVMLTSGGIGGTGIFWFFVFPLSAFFVAGKKAGIWWIAGLFATVLACLVLAQINYIGIPYSPLTIRQLLISLLVVSIGIYAYQQSRETLVLETQQSEEVSEEEKIKAQTIVENIDEGVVALDKTGRAVLVNEAAEEMLGWKRAELLNKNFIDAVPFISAKTPHGQSQERPFLQALKQPGTIRNNITYVRKDGTTFPVAIVTKSVVVNGKIHGAISTFRDTSQEQAIDHAKSEFVTLASHQLRTPISAIAWMGELLLSGDAGKLAPEQRDYIQSIYQSNERMAALVNAMLAVSSLEMGSLQMRVEQIDLGKLSHQVLKAQLKTIPEPKELHIQETYDPDLPKLSLDPVICKMIIKNLISNAVKYTPTNGSVHISIQLSAERLKSHAPSQSVLIEIADTGAGIPKRQQPKIFTKLFRADNIKGEDTDGTGLGLYIVKTATEYMGGRVWFTSTENKGSTFSVLLPLAMDPALHAKEQKSTS